MIRGRKEGSNYATWFIGFDHDDAFGLAPFPELPPSRSSSTTPTSNRHHLSASSLERLTPIPNAQRGKSPIRSATPIGTQTPARHVAGQQISTQTSVEFGDASAQTLPVPEKKLRTTSIGTDATEGVDNGVGYNTATHVKSTKSVETATQPDPPISKTGLGPENHKENGEVHCNGRSRERTLSSSSSSTYVTNSKPARNNQAPDIPANAHPPSDSVDGIGRSRSNSKEGGTRPNSEDFDSSRARRKRDKQTEGLYREAFDGAKRAEEFKFRVKFDQFLGELHVALDEKSPQGLPASFASPSYGEVMLTFRDKVKDLLKGFTQRLQLAHESFGSVEPPEETAQRVKQDVARFIEDLIGETLDLTSDEAVSDLSSLSDDSSPDNHPTFEDLLAQALVTKLLENHRKAVRDSLLEPGNANSLLNRNHQSRNNNLYSSSTNGGLTDNHQYHSFDHTDQHIDQLFDFHHHDKNHQDLPYTTNDNFHHHQQSPEREYHRVKNFISLDQNVLERGGQSVYGSRDYSGSTGDLRGGYSNTHRSPHPRDVFGGNRQASVSVSSLNADHSLTAITGGSPYSRTLSNQGSLNNSQLLVPDNLNHTSLEEREHDNEYENRFSPRHEQGQSDNGVGEIFHPDTTYDLESKGQGLRPQSPADPEKEFAELRDFVRQTQQQAKSKVEAKVVEEVLERAEVKEEQLSQTAVDRDEERQNFHDRYSILDRVHNSEPPLPDFSQFENIDFASSEIDPDLLSMNLAIIPEETEEELEQEEEDEDEDGEEGRGKWRNNWIFKGKGVSVYDNIGKKRVGRLDEDGPLFMMVPRPEDDYVPKIGNRDVDQLSDFSEGDLLSRSDLDNTDDEDDADDENSFYANTSKELARIASRRLRSNGTDARRSDKSKYGLDDDDNHIDHRPVEDVPGPIVQPAKPEVKLMYDLIPAEGDDPKFVVPPESVTVQKGEPVQFSCRVAGSHPYDVFWYREGAEVEELEEGEDIELGNSGDKYWCNLYNVGQNEAGQYMCIALSEKGKAVQYLVVSVKENKQELKKPEFLKGLKDVEVTEGQSVKFRVKVKGYPQPRVNWFKDGQLLRHSKSCRIEKFGNRDYILTIDYATMDDDAEYTVSAKNVAGTEKLSAQVIVEPRSELPPRKQMISSVTTSAASDSDSDFPSASKRRSYNSYNVSGSKLPAAPSSSSSSPQLVSARRATSPTSLLSPPQQTSTPLPSSSSSSHRLAVRSTQPLSDRKQEVEASLDKDGGESSAAMSQAAFEMLLPSLTATASATSPRTAMQERENEVNLNHLDRKVTLTQKRVEEEADKMEEDARKNRSSSPSVKSPSATTQDILRLSNETLRLESTDTGKTSKTPSAQADNSNSVIDLDLPDELDDFPLPGGAQKPASKTKAVPKKSTFAMSIAGSGKQKNDDFDDAEWSKPSVEKGKFKSEVSFPKNNNNNDNSNNNKNNNVLLASPLSQHPQLAPGITSAAATTTNINNLSFDSGNGGSVTGGDNATASLASSVSSSTSSLGSATNTGDPDLENQGSPAARLSKGRYSRDFDITSAQQQKKKWSVTLDPFSPQAEVINRQQEEKSKISETEIQTPLSPLSSQPQRLQNTTPTTTTTSTSNAPRRRSIPKEERPPPVHMVGISSEADLPESRTEFNTDGSVELPSVNRLKALFSGGSGGAGSQQGGGFKRATSPHAEYPRQL